jgi:hypothetical protein
MVAIGEATMMSDDEIDRALIHGEGDVERAVFETMGRIAGAPARDTDVEVVVHTERFAGGRTIYDDVNDMVRRNERELADDLYRQMVYRPPTSSLMPPADAQSSVFDRAAFDRAVEHTPIVSAVECATFETRARVFERHVLEVGLRERVRTMGLHIIGGIS